MQEVYIHTHTRIHIYISMTNSHRDSSNMTTRTPYTEPGKLPTMLDSNLRTPLRRPNRHIDNDNDIGSNNSNSFNSYGHGVGGLDRDRKYVAGGDSDVATAGGLGQPLVTFKTKSEFELGGGYGSGSDHDNDYDYDYTPFTSKQLLCEDKIRSFMEAERAEHCLVFHRASHSLDKDVFRADLHTECGEFEMGTFTTGDCVDTAELVTDEDIIVDGKSQVKRGGRPAVRSTAIKDGGRRETGTLQFNSNRNNIVQTRMPQLKAFWGDSQLISSLSLELLERENALLLKELEQLDTVKREMQVKVTRRFKSHLAKRCHRVYKTSWSNASLGF